MILRRVIGHFRQPESHAIALHSVKVTKYIASVHKWASLPVMDSLRKNGVLLRSHLQ